MGQDCVNIFAKFVVNNLKFVENLYLVFMIRSDINWAVQLQKIARGLKFRI